MTLGAQIRKYRDKLGWKLETLSFKSGVEVGTISALENRNSKRSQFAPALAAAFGLSLEQLLDESVEYDIGNSDHHNFGHPVASIGDEDHLSDDYIQIRESEVRFAAGNGRQALFDEVEASVPRTYRRSWFAQEGINPANTRCCKVHGDSMEPFLFDGDSVLIHLAERDVINGKVYAIRYGDELRIKRVYKKLDGGLVLRSDNPAFLPRDEDVPSAVVDEHIGIIGRVRDKSGTGGL